MKYIKSVLPAVLLAALVVGAGASGVYLVPKALEAKPLPSATPAFGEGAQGSAPPGGWPSAGAPGGLPGGPCPAHHAPCLRPAPAG